MTSDTPWRKATRSGGNGGQCVEVRRHHGTIEVRDSKAGGAGPVLRFTREQWSAFLAGTKGAEFDHPLG
jgi:hypothetical protein